MYMSRPSLSWVWCGLLHTVIRSTHTHTHTPAAPYTGPVDALWKICNSKSAPNMVTVTELVNAGIDVNYAVSGRDKAGGGRRGTGGRGR